ncbi:hypothetical protein D9611_013073 [Ephemerocybe angulata]|uniref:HhH-GPD domain-containing protein n=1 Tax=Ephemerocybe angulata TaxID=980116 RepID=A0A8H5BXT3_9AGAR|nr:hypothetical protein D9611_013073 [Tulosesus angulatus]
MSLKRTRTHNIKGGNAAPSPEPTPSREMKPLMRIRDEALETSPTPSPASKKMKLLASYSTTSPFPEFEHPTPTEAREVHDLLAKSLNMQPPTKGARRFEKNSATSCGNVQNVVDSLIGTILSQNTSSRNSSKAKALLDRKFGKHNFEAIANAPLEDIVDALRCGGLANKKGATIQKLLRSIKERHGDYSLQYLASTDSDGSGAKLTDDEIMQELISYDGVGPKTASCVLLFCLQRDSFAVDTHVYRLSKLLGWVPGKADRVRAQAHLDKRIPDELKYGLHVMLIQHGRLCKGCKKDGAKEECVLKDYIRKST